MAVTTTDDVESIARAVLVTVRVPNGANGDLTSEAERRLTRVDGVIEATVDGLRGLEPQLSATVVTVEATVTAEGHLGAGDLREELASAAGVELTELADG